MVKHVGALSIGVSTGWEEPRCPDRDTHGLDALGQRKLRYGFPTRACDSLPSYVAFDEYVDPGGKDVVLITDNEVRGATSGTPLAGTTALVLTLEHGMAVRGQYFNSKSEALEAVGLSE